MNHIEIEHRGKTYFKSNGKWHLYTGERKPEMDDVLNEKLSILEDEKLLVGEINGEIFVFDRDLPVADNEVMFWSLSRDRFLDLDRAYAKAAVLIVERKDRKLAINKYRNSAVVRHRLRFQRMGKMYTGIRESVKAVPRVTHCWSCKCSLTSGAFPECIACGWILCECGACGCGRR